MNIVNKQDGDKEVIDFVVRALHEGKVIAYPTETVYGLGCDATNKRAIKKIYALKGKSESKLLLVLVANMAMAKKYVVFNKMASMLAKEYWPHSAKASRGVPQSKKSPASPAIASLVAEASAKETATAGALTLILPTTLSGKKIFGSSTLGLRVSSNPIACAIVKSLGVPLISTSANLTNQEPARSGREVIDIFAQASTEPDLILDAGKLKKSKGSTIADCTGSDMKIIRQGDIKIKSSNTK